jgi:hypothetical protein
VSASTRAESRAAPTGQRLRRPGFQRCRRRQAGCFSRARCPSRRRAPQGALGISVYSTAQGARDRAWGVGSTGTSLSDQPRPRYGSFRARLPLVSAQATVARMGKTVQRRDPLTPGDGRRAFLVFLRDRVVACVGPRLGVRRDLSSTGSPDRVPRPLPAPVDPP